MTTLRNRIDARAAQVQRAGFLGAWAVLAGDETMIGTRAPCGASLKIPLTGDLPVCAATCECTQDAKRRAKERRR